MRATWLNCAWDSGTAAENLNRTLFRLPPPGRAAQSHYAPHEGLGGVCKGTWVGISCVVGGVIESAEWKRNSQGCLQRARRSNTLSWTWEGLTTAYCLLSGEYWVLGTCFSLLTRCIERRVRSSKINHTVFTLQEWACLTTSKEMSTHK